MRPNGRRRPLLIAHRGASGLAPENTMASFQIALDFGADAVEFDVRATRDGELVVFHDERMERTTNSHGLLSSFTLSELKQLDAGSWFDAKYEGERVSTLREALALLKGKAMAMVEMKVAGIETGVLAEIDSMDATDWAMVVSGSEYALKTVRSLNPRLPCALARHLAPDGGEEALRRLAQNALEAGAHILISCLNPREREYLNLRGLSVWGEFGDAEEATTDDPERIAELIDWGAEAILTNRIDLARGLLDARS